MPGPSPSTSTVVNKTELPKWISDAGKSNYDKAIALDKAPLQQYAGPTVAAPSDDTTGAFDYFKSHMNAGAADSAAASKVFKSLSDPASFKAGVSSYMDPYIDNVESKSLDALGDQRRQSLMENSDKAHAAGAFGGSRGAIVDAVTNAESAKDAGLLSAQLRSAGYNDAASRWSTNTATAGQGLLSTADQQQTQMLKRYAGLSDIGTKTDTYNQKVIDGKVSKFNEKRDKELNDLNVRLSALGMTPYPTSSSTKTTATPGSAGFDWGSAGLGVLSLLTGFL